MATKHIDRDNLTVTGAHEKLGDNANVEVRDDVTVVVAQAFGPRGDNLVGISDVTFDGFPALTLLVRTGEREGLVHLSPIHGDSRKAGFTDIPIGAKCELLCPVSKQPLDQVGEIGGDHSAHYYAIYLTPRLHDGSMVAISDVWGHYHSRVVDNFELISQWESQHEDLG